MKTAKEVGLEKHTYTDGERVDKFCAACKEERGHVVAALTTRGQISRVACTRCGTRSTFKIGTGTQRRAAAASDPYDQGRTYRAGQSLTHPLFGSGEVTAVLDARKIDVLFNDRVRRLVHARA